VWSAPARGQSAQTALDAAIADTMTITNVLIFGGEKYRDPLDEARRPIALPITQF